MGTVSLLDVVFRTGETAQANTRIVTAGQRQQEWYILPVHTSGGKGTWGLSDLACTATIANYKLCMFYSDKNNLSNKRL